jgi:iron(III) transport system ATP-binding protein
MSVLSIRGLGKRYGAVTALADFDLDVAAGSRTAVVGPSGSGKTTLLRLVAGFEAPDSGEIRIGGTLVADPSAGLPTHRRNIGLVMQEGALFPHLSVFENIRFGIRDDTDGARRVAELMDLVELDRAMSARQPHQLSGGQQQRVALARALARKPRIMLLDEPFSALDTGLRDQLRNATASILAAAGVATLLVTHDQREAMEFADQLVVLREGRLLQSGAPRDLYLGPADATTAAFLGPAIFLDAELRDGAARSALGRLPLAASQSDRTGPARIMLRPEQLEMLPADGAEGSECACRITSIRHVGPDARISAKFLAHSLVLDFDAKSHNLPPVGAMVRLSARGTAWVVGSAEVGAAA